MPRALTHEEKNHPAKYSTEVLSALRALLRDWDVRGRVLDPYAGVGWIHRIDCITNPTFAAELERPWARNHGHAGRTVQADADQLPYPDGTFAAVCTSAVYLNRMRDHHKANDSSTRITYTHKMRNLLANPRYTLNKRNMGAMTNSQYRRAAQSHIREFRRVTAPGGLFMLNMSNSMEDKGETNAVEQWINWLTLASCWIREVRPVSTRRMRYGENWESRVEHEVIIVAQFPPARSQGRLL